MVWGALLAAGVSALGSGATMAAGDKAAEGAQNAADAQLQMYNQNRADLAPYREAGGHALNAYSRAMGLPAYGEGGARSTDPTKAYQYSTSGKVKAHEVQKAYKEFMGRPPTAKELNYYTKRSRGDQLYNNVVLPGINKLEAQQAQQAQQGGQPQSAEDPYGGFMESPGYQFRFDEGQRAVDRNAAARGRYMSGAREKASIRYGQNQASNEFGNYMNRLAGLSGIGQTATNTGVQAGMNAAGNAGNAMIAQGQSRASGYMGAANTAMNAYNNWQAGAPYRQQQNSAWGPYQSGYRMGA